MIAFSLSNANFKENKGAIATFVLKTPEIEGIFPLELKEAIIADIRAKNLITGTVNGKIKLSK